MYRHYSKHNRYRNGGENPARHPCPLGAYTVALQGDNKYVKYTKHLSGLRANQAKNKDSAECGGWKQW